MNPVGVEFFIDELMVEASNSMSQADIRAAITAELSKWVAEKGNSLADFKSTTINLLQSDVPVQAMTTANSIGQQVTRTLENSVKPKE